MSKGCIGPEGAKDIANGLEVNAVLTSLDLSFNNLAGETGYINSTEVEGDSKEEGAKVVYQGREMTVIKGIDEDGELRMADFSGVLALANALKVNAAMTKIVLSYNEIKDEGAIALGKALKINKSLNELQLVDCGIGTEGGKALASALSEGSAVMTTLNLSDNALCGLRYGQGTYDASGIKALASALEVNRVLTSLNVGLTNLNSPAGALFRDPGTPSVAPPG